MNSADNVFNTNLRFDQVAVGTEGNATLALFLARKSGHHNYLDVFGFGCTA